MITNYINSKGQSLVISEMNFVYLQNAIRKLRMQLQTGPLIRNHDDRIRFQNTLEALEKEFKTRPEYILPPEERPVYKSKIAPSVDNEEEDEDLDTDF